MVRKSVGFLFRVLHLLTSHFSLYFYAFVHANEEGFMVRSCPFICMLLCMLVLFGCPIVLNETARDSFADPIVLVSSENTITRLDSCGLHSVQNDTQQSLGVRRHLFIYQLHSDVVHILV